MASRIYNRILECGCMFSSDAGGCHIPCYAELGDMKKKKDREALKLCRDSYKKWVKSKDYKLYLKECREKNR